MPPLWEQLLPIGLCVAGIVVLARIVHVQTRDAPDGRRYTYWQPWRIWGLGLCFGLFALLGLVMWLIGPPTPPAG